MGQGRIPVLLDASGEIQAQKLGGLPWMRGEDGGVRQARCCLRAGEVIESVRVQNHGEGQVGPANKVKNQAPGGFLHPQAWTQDEGLGLGHFFRQASTLFRMFNQSIKPTH